MSPALGVAVRSGQDAEVLHITEDKALRSEYLAWPAAHIVGYKL